MICPKCGGHTEVKDTRTADKQTIRRRRECMACNHRFATIETEDKSKPLRQWVPKSEKPSVPKVPKPRVARFSPKRKEEPRRMEEEISFSMEDPEDLSVYVDLPRREY